ncbi:hypothetical protein J6590_027626 [Homalodisca vitripennis]|nr:hypothetical protein J6590_027626 [Homalodisca vitripennis]
MGTADKPQDKSTLDATCFTIDGHVKRQPATACLIAAGVPTVEAGQHQHRGYKESDINRDIIYCIASDTEGGRKQQKTFLVGRRPINAMLRGGQTERWARVVRRHVPRDNRLRPTATQQSPVRRGSDRCRNEWAQTPLAATPSRSLGDILPSSKYSEPNLTGFTELNEFPQQTRTKISGAVTDNDAMAPPSQDDHQTRHSDRLGRKRGRGHVIVKPKPSVTTAYIE